MKLKLALKWLPELYCHSNKNTCGNCIVAETTEDFWRMMWEHNCTIVVMLTKTREMGREKCHQYWPESRSARYQYFVVDPHAEYNMPEYTLREFKVTDARVSITSCVGLLF